MYKLRLWLTQFFKFNNLKQYEEFIGLYSLKNKERRKYFRDKNQGKYWLACSPEWITGSPKIDTEYKICYWVNYGDNNTYGRFSVEQILYWLRNKEIKLHTLGGTKER